VGIKGKGNKNKPCKIRYKNEERWKKNKARKKAKHARKLAKQKARREAK
jgi:hypothetical protein